MHHIDQYITLRRYYNYNRRNCYLVTVIQKGTDIQATGIDVFIDATHNLQVIIQRLVDILPESYDVHIDSDRPNDIFKLVDKDKGLSFNVFIDPDYVTIGYVDMIDGYRVVSMTELTN